MSKTILLADDSVTIRKVVELTFMEEDYELVSLPGGEEAVAQLAEVDPDLVIADVHMPGVTGYDVCLAAKEGRPGRPVLLLVGTFEPFDAAELEASGADAHLKKPFDSQELLQTVRDLLARDDDAAAEGEAEAPAEQAAAAGPEPDPAAAGESGEVLSTPAAEDLAADAASSAAVFEPQGPAAGATEPASPAAEPATAAGNGAAELSEEAVERIARRVAELLGPEVVREVAWEVVPDLAEVVIKERLRELESQVE